MEKHLLRSNRFLLTEAVKLPGTATQEPGFTRRVVGRWGGPVPKCVDRSVHMIGRNVVLAWHWARHLNSIQQDAIWIATVPRLESRLLPDDEEDPAQCSPHVKSPVALPCFFTPEGTSNWCSLLHASGRFVER